MSEIHVNKLVILFVQKVIKKWQYSYKMLQQQGDKKSAVIKTSEIL